MVFKIKMGLLILLIYSACAPKTSKVQQQMANRLQIENSPTRGSGYTDSLGMKFGLVYITATITNDHTIPVHIELDIPFEYSYPEEYGKAQFQVVILPEEWGLDGMGISDEMIRTIPKSIVKSFSTKTLAPREKYVATIGILRPVRPKLCSATPYAIMVYGQGGVLSSCDWVLDEDRVSEPEHLLGLKVGFCTVGQDFETCMIIPCGRISFSDQ